MDSYKEREIICKEICCKSERNMLQIGEKSGGNPANPARREEGVGGNLNFAPNMRETTCQLVAASYPTFCPGKNFRRLPLNFTISEEFLLCSDFITGEEGLVAGLLLDLERKLLFGERGDSLHCCRRFKRLDLYCDTVAPAEGGEPHQTCNGKRV